MIYDKIHKKVHRKIKAKDAAPLFKILHVKPGLSLNSGLFPGVKWLRNLPVLDKLDIKIFYEPVRLISLEEPGGGGQGGTSI